MSSVLTANISKRYAEIWKEVSAEHPIGDADDLWQMMRVEADKKAADEPILGSYFHATILNHPTFGSALPAGRTRTVLVSQTWNPASQ